MAPQLAIGSFNLGGATVASRGEEKLLFKGMFKLIPEDIMLT